MRVTVFVFAVELQKVGNKCTSTDFWERTGASFKMAYMWKGEDSIEKNLFLRIHIEILQLGLNMIKMALQWKSKWVSPPRVQHPLSRLRSPWGSRTQQQANCLRYAHSQHIESHLGKKQPQAKIPIAFLFSKLHFNNVTSDAPIYHGGRYLVMRSNWEMRIAKPANHLNTGIPIFSNQCIHDFTSLNLITVHTKNDKNAIYIRHNVKAFSGWIDDILHSILIHGMGLLKLV